MLYFIVNKILNSNSYILPIGYKKKCYLIDCGDVDQIIEQGWNVVGVLLTHSHFDHIYGLNKLLEVFPDVLVYTNQAGRDGLLNEKLNMSKYHSEMENYVFNKPENIRVFEREGNKVLNGELNVDVLFTPGHEPSCVSYIINNNLFTGDAYIPGIDTYYKFPRSNKELALDSLHKLRELEIKYGYRVCPGHHVKNT